MAEIFAGITTKAQRAVRDATGLILAIIGAGSAASVCEVIRSWFPEQTKTLSDETLAAIVSFIIFNWGDRIHERLSAFGFGMLLDSVGALIGGYVADLIKGLAKK